MFGAVCSGVLVTRSLLHYWAQNETRCCVMGRSGHIHTQGHTYGQIGLGNNDNAANNDANGCDAAASNVHPTLRHTLSENRFPSRLPTCQV